MRRFLEAIIAFCIICFVSAYAFAEFASVMKSNLTATVTFTDSGSSQSSAISMHIELKNRLNNNSTTWIWWDASQIKKGETDWRIADSYIVLYSTITNSTAGIQIYTDNKAPDADPKFTGTGPFANPAGLVAVDSPNIDPLPLCWRVVDVSTNTLDIVQVNRTDGNVTTSSLYCPAFETASNPQDYSYPCFFWMKDRYTPSMPQYATTVFENGEDYITVKDANGIHHAGGYNWGQTQSPDCIYIGAKFENVNYGMYKTSTIRIEAFTE